MIIGDDMRGPVDVFREGKRVDDDRDGLPNVAVVARMVKTENLEEYLSSLEPQFKYYHFYQKLGNRTRFGVS